MPLGGGDGDAAGPLLTIHHVALPVGDAAPPLAFYRDVLGLTPVDRPEGASERADGSWFELGDGQVHLFRPGDAPVAPPPFAIEVHDLAATVAAIRSHGVTVYDGEHIHGFGYQAMVLDPSGNLIELNKPD
jgi:catechol 2,3-dioxygenase-like lactoylglutathione lyase family enzyme